MAKPEIEAALKALGDEVAEKVRDILVNDMGALGSELKPLLDNINLWTVKAVRDALAGDRKEIGSENLKMLGHQIELCGALVTQETMQSLRSLAMEILPVALKLAVRVLASL
jgi:hypothetical protein